MRCVLPLVEMSFACIRSNFCSVHVDAKSINEQRKKTNLNSGSSRFMDAQYGIRMSDKAGKDLWMDWV